MSHAHEEDGAIDYEEETLCAGQTVTGWDPEGWLYFFRMRYYDPRTGRFTSEDRIGFKADANFYRYVRDNPVRYVDPVGLSSSGWEGSTCCSRQWVADHVGFSGGVDQIWASVGIGKLTCTSNHFTYPWAFTRCEWQNGMILTAGPGLDVQISGSAITGPCRAEDLKPFTTEGRVCNIGPLSIAGGSDGVNVGIGSSGWGCVEIRCTVIPF